MDRTVPPGAAKLLDFIGSIEAPLGYDTIYGNNQGKLPKPVTQMTVDEVQAAQKDWTKRFGSSATGRYQFMRATLAGLADELGLSGTQKLDAGLQDRLAYHLLKRRGYEAFMADQIGRAEFGKRLAMEWASFPVLAGTQGAHRQVSRGQSYYAGDGLNKSLVKPEEVEAVLDAVLTAPQKPAEPIPAPVAPPLPDYAPPPPAPVQQPAGKAPYVIAAVIIIAAVTAVALKALGYF